MQFREILKEELKPILTVLGEHSKILDQHTKILDQHTKILDQHSKILEKHTRQIEDIIVELHEVHRLATATSDIVKARYEKNKREIDEIKDHLGLRKEPYFAE